MAYGNSAGRVYNEELADEVCAVVADGVRYRVCPWRHFVRCGCMTITRMQRLRTCADFGEELGLVCAVERQTADTHAVPVQNVTKNNGGTRVTHRMTPQDQTSTAQPS